MTLLRLKYTIIFIDALHRVTSEIKFYDPRKITAHH